MHRQIFALAILATLAACSSAPQNEVRVTSTPYADGKSHTEPVNYNGRNYRVTFHYSPAISGYQVRVAAPGRKIGSTEGDKAIIEQMAKSTVAHFGCPSSQKGHVISGSARNENGVWHLRVRCG